MNKRRVLACAFVCCPPATPGFTGGEDILGWNLLQQVARYNEVWALTHAEDRESIENTLVERPIPNVHFHYVNLPDWLKPLLKIQGGHQIYYYLWQMRAYFVARRLHRKFNFDLFHHITYANDWMVSFIGAFLSIPYIRGPGGGAHKTPSSLQGEYTFKGRVWEKVRTIGQWILRHDPLFIKGQKRADAILVCNHDSAESVPSRWSHKVHLFPVSGVSSEDLNQIALTDVKTTKFRVLSAGSLIRVKGFGLAIKAFRIFSEKHPNSSLIIAGEGPEKTRIMNLICTSNLKGHVELIGAVPRNRLLSMMSESDVILFPSLRDGGGTVVVEAMSMSRPVICLDIGGPGLHINDECGIKIHPDTPERTIQSIAMALERLYLDDELRRELGRASRQRAERLYHWDKLGDRLSDIYGSVTPKVK